MTRGSLGLAGNERGGVERWVVWLVTIVVTVALVGSVVYVGDELRRDSPDAEFAVEFDEEAGALTVEHAGGDAVSDRMTQRLSVAVVDESEGTNETVTWVADDRGPTKRGSGYPVAPGDVLTVDDPSVDADGDGSYLDGDRSVGFYLESGDAVRVVWESSGESVTLANATL